MLRRSKKNDREVVGECSEKILKLAEISKSRSNNWFSQSVLIPKDFHYVLSLIEKCLKHIINSDINFKANPPYLPGILRNFNHKIIDILKCYENDLGELSKINFFRVSIWTLIKQCKEVLRIIRNVKSAIFDEFSELRQKLTNISILLSHLFHAVVALFPNSCYSPETFRITKSDAADWWNSQFGPLTTVVEWNDFFHFFSKINYISEVSQIAALRKTINVTGNGFVSIFDFDVFVRLFQPWKNILESWKVIVLEHPGCMSYLTYEQVVQLLKSFRCYPGPGSYVFRFSCTKPGQWAIGYIDFSGKIYQTIVHNKSLAIALFEGEKAGIYKFPNGKVHDSSILYKLINSPLQNVSVSLEEHEAYCRIDSSFEICKICEQNNKNVKLEPCGHLLCNFCLTKWQKSFRCQSCPFCRLEIKGIEKISLIPYEIGSDDNTNNINSNATKIVSEYPIIPPRLSSTIGDDRLSPIVVVGHETIGKVNYAQLEWMSINDSGYCVNATYDDENSESLVNAKVVQLDSMENCVTAPNRYAADGKNSGHYESAYPPAPLQQQQPHYLNTTCNSPMSGATGTFSDNGSSHNGHHSTLMHITNGSEALKKLLKITGNDVTMSQEILRYFTPRSVSICSNS